MGKGGETELKHPQLLRLDLSDLQFWAKQYGIASSESREVLLQKLDAFGGGVLDSERPKENLPLTPPPFTLTDIRKAIPSHCFQRNLWISLSHLLSDLVTIAILGYLAYWIDFYSKTQSPWVGFFFWPLYWYAQGAVMTGVWVLSHECGHQSFSESEFVNNLVGTIFHSLLLVPYHPWRITHGLHHNNTGSCENDEVFAPSTRNDWKNDVLRETPLAQLWGIVIMLTIGWMPGYLVFNATGPSKYRGKNANHFSPEAVFYKNEERPLVVQSDIAFFTSLALLAYCFVTFGGRNVCFYYIIPYFITNYHLVLITYLQHTDVYMPHFRGDEWSWLRGALCTVDRSFGPLLDHTFHHITDTHVCHHLFSKMPFYHAQEATEAMKKVLGSYYLKDDTPIAKALYRSFSNCQFIEDEGAINFYKNKK